jgi:hypothetical protein
MQNDVILITLIITIKFFEVDSPRKKENYLTNIFNYLF